MAALLRTVWVFGDQLNRNIGALQAAQPDTHRVLIIESSGKIASRPWHIQRAHFLVTSMRRFALALEHEGFQVDQQRDENSSRHMVGLPNFILDPSCLHRK